MNLPKKSLFMFPILALLCIAAAPSSYSVIVHGDGMEEWQWTPARLEREMKKEIQTISYSVHGEHHTSRAIPLLAILSRDNVNTKTQMGEFADARTKNRFLHLVVLVRGRDGYSAAIDIAELLPNIGNHPAFIALDADGKPWDARHAPAELIIPSDASPVRWIRGVSEIRVVDINPAPTTRPTAH